MKILVIDDDYFVRYTLARILRGNGYEVVTAADGELGMNVFRSAAPDLVAPALSVRRRGPGSGGTVRAQRLSGAPR